MTERDYDEEERNGDGQEGGENDIAIVGMACRFPGARNIHEYWHNLQNGVESILPLTDEQLLAEGVSAETLKHPNYVKRCAVLQDMEQFDAEFFGFSPKEAAIMDPQHRNFLECAWEAMEDAGHLPETYDGSIGVYAGCGMGSYFMFNLLTNPDLVDNVGMFLLRHTGNDKDFLSTRVSYCFNLTGPSINVQTACSTSLVAVHTACQNLLNGETDLALAGGVTIDMPHRRGYYFKENEILSPDGHCRAFDHRSKGTVFGSGAGVVVLRRLDDALDDGDHIYAVIKGSAINNDGSAKVGYLAPSVDGQAAAIAEALAVANLEADTINYVECHGTGTPMGDPIEVSALTQAFRQTTKRKGFCGIGSVKTNIGHLDTAAGVASLIKTSLALQGRKLPPSLNWEAPNPQIDFESSPFYVNHQLNPWKEGDTPRRAGINSLGVGGTNAFAIVEEAPERDPTDPHDAPFHLITLSARNRAALDDYGKRLAAHLRAHPDLDMADVCYTLLTGRRAFDTRRVVAVRDAAEAAELLASGDTRRLFTHTVESGTPSLVFMYAGGGCQYPRMGRDLYEAEPVFKKHVDRGLKLLAKLDGVDWDPRDLFFAEAGRDEEVDTVLQRPAVQLPLIFIVQYALTQYWIDQGVEPKALIGHSLGENTAACVAGVFSFKDALGLVTLRGQLFETVPRGGMISVGLAPERVREILNDHPDLDLATINSPEFCVVSGPSEPLDALLRDLEAREIEARRVPIDIAAHSRMLENILLPFGEYLRSIKLNPPKIPFVSNGSGTWITDQEATSPDYWVGHLRNTVHFAEGVTILLEEKNRVFLEVGPGRTLVSLVKQHSGITPTSNLLHTLRHPRDLVDDRAFLLAARGRLWAAGFDIDLKQIFGDEFRHRVSLPTYAFRHQRFFIEPGKIKLAEDDAAHMLYKMRKEEDWYYQPAWKKRRPIPSSEDQTYTWLVFLDDAGIGKRLVAFLHANGHEAVTVREGDAYYKISPNEYLLSPEHGLKEYEDLLRDLVNNGKTPHRIAHCWMLTAEESFRPGSSFFHRNQERGFYSLFFLAKAFANENVPGPMHMVVLTNGTVQVGEEDLPYPEKATLLGPAKVIPREFPEITCATVDVELPQIDQLSFGRKRFPEAYRLDRLAALVEDELLAEPGNHLCAYRGQTRWELHYDRNAPRKVKGVPNRIKAGGAYLITGGLGGLGLVMAQYLAEHAKAKLVLMSRSPLPPRSEWDHWLDSTPETHRTHQRIAKIRHLEELGAEVELGVADVTDIDAMREVVEEAERQFGSIDGVLHTAGVLKDDLIQLKTQSDIEDVFTPKIHGTLMLDELFRDRELDFMVLFSSTSSVISPAGQIDYVAANAFLNSYAQSRASLPNRNTVAINWGVWGEVGMAADAAGRMQGGEEPSGDLAPAKHPLFDTRETDEHGISVLRATYTTKNQWVLDQHRTLKGHAIVVGTGYLEMARAALVERGERNSYEIADLYFFRPFYVADDEQKDMRVRMRPDEDELLFDVQSKRVFDDGRIGWETHAQARLIPYASPAVDPVDLEAIRARCTQKHQADPDGFRTGQERFMQFGSRWRVLQTADYGDGEAIAKLQLPKAFEAEQADYQLHPALLDLATGYAMDLIEGYEGTDQLWVPVNYKSVRIRGPLPRLVYSWMRNHGRNRAEGETATFDITITDEQGKVLLEVEQFSIKKLDGGPDFAVAKPPSASELEFEVQHNDEGERQLSPAEKMFRHNLGQGILPEEGTRALAHILEAEATPQVIFSSLDLHKLIQQTEESTREQEEADESTKFDRPELSSEYVEPRDEIEKTLAGIWEELLGVNNIGIKDSFFDLGGHSLIAVRLFAKIKKAYQVEYPISVLFEAPTIEGCADMIRDAVGDQAAAEGDQAASTSAESESRKRRYTHLVAMHQGKGGDRTPFFLVAGMFGNVLNLRHLAHLIGTDRKFFGLQARGLYGGDQPHENFEEMARDYLAEVRTVQPKGPYFIGGFSGGGITAYEMAQQLREQGEEVSLLVMLDTPIPKRPYLTKTDRRKIHLIKLKQRGFAHLREWAEERYAWELKKIRRRMGEEVEEETPQVAFHSQDIEAAFYRSLEKYDLKDYTGPVKLFRPKLDKCYPVGDDRYVSSEMEYVFEDNLWTPHVGELEVFEVPGNHDSMVLEPNVRILATKLRRCIQEAEGRI
ncbi:SDR family NAD(P)-dependent oxidoreductase [Sulfidibacter corallicola]|uniref:Phenolphthiocerol/phthiocerol polyketide synthase subunit E n=1 Tax=Sulfidibacter corallicola TaxID=2818388 RepID=A0A8A4TQR5_SULCO|nr:type I polyketide synthase [Sulfidibacter corallicola]QTD52326.1 SDR family NAD(P)-dependent oxidoreductase [Sulfidibacter corallicola]